MDCNKQKGNFAGLLEENLQESMDSTGKSIKVNDIDDLPEAAEAIAKMLDSHPIVAFHGPMGAGKTTLIREICNLLGVTDTVTSPTFALVNHYMRPDEEPVFHFDFYRIEHIEEVFDMGYEEYFFGGGVCLVEWPEKIGDLLPEDALHVTIEVTGHESRLIHMAVGEPA